MRQLLFLAVSGAAALTVAGCLPPAACDTRADCQQDEVCLRGFCVAAPVSEPDDGGPAAPDGGASPSPDGGAPDAGRFDGGRIDAGAPSDGGRADAGPRPDAGSGPDAGQPLDAGSDGGPLDAGEPADAGPLPDAGEALDAGATDPGPLPDAGPGCTTPEVSGLVTSGLVDTPSAFHILADYPVPAAPSSILLVTVAAEDDNQAGDCLPSSVTFGGTPLTEVVSHAEPIRQGKCAALFALRRPPEASTEDIVVTVSGLVESLLISAYTVSCLADAPALTVGTDDASPGTSVAIELTVSTSPVFVVDVLEHGANAAGVLAVPQENLPDQVMLFAEDTPSSATSSHAASYRYADAPGSYNMGWVSPGSSNRLAYVAAAFAVE